MTDLVTTTPNFALTSLFTKPSSMSQAPRPMGHNNPQAPPFNANALAASIFADTVARERGAREELKDLMGTMEAGMSALKPPRRPKPSVDIVSVRMRVLSFIFERVLIAVGIDPVKAMLMAQGDFSIDKLRRFFPPCDYPELKHEYPPGDPFTIFGPTHHPMVRALPCLFLIDASSDNN